MISVITVVLNDPDGFRETALSVVSQTSSDYEWIVVDGGSGAEMRAVLDEYRPFAMCVLSEADNGIYEAMNKGVALSHGEYAIFMNAGDTFFSDSVLHHIQVLLAKYDGLDIVLGGTCKTMEGCVVYSPPRHMSSIIHGMPAFHQSVIFRLALLRRAAYDEELMLLADYKWLAVLAVDGGVIGYCDFPVSVYRVGGISYKRPVLRSREVYRIQRKVLGRGRVLAVVASLRVFIKTVLLTGVVLRLCGYFSFISCGERSGSDVGFYAEHYKYKV